MTVKNISEYASNTLAHYILPVFSAFETILTVGKSTQRDMNWPKTF